jgi:uncharacterized membrane protein
MTLFPDWQRIALMLFGDDVIVFTVLALGVAGFIYAVSVLWDVTREADDDLAS